MALTYTVDDIMSQSAGVENLSQVILKLSVSEYASGGVPLKGILKPYLRNGILGCNFVQGNTKGKVFAWVYDGATDKLVAYVPDTGSEASTVDVGTVIVGILGW